MSNHSFPANLYTSDTLPDGRLNQCTALTRRGRRCKNPIVSGGQFGIFGIEEAVVLNGETLYKEVCIVSQEEFDDMQSETCHIHR